MQKNRTKRFCKKEKELMRKNLDLARKFLLEIINDPKKVESIPSGATIILYPVKV
ncbi:MAG: hypothetical protein AB1633_03420 [Elusimicrobiota bacterium]